MKVNKHKDLHKLDKIQLRSIRYFYKLIKAQLDFYNYTCPLGCELSMSDVLTHLTKTK